MKLKCCFMTLLIIIMITSTVCVFADDFTLDDDYKFTLPENFTVINQTEDTVELKIDDFHLLTFGISDEITSQADSIKALENLGYKVTSNQTINIDGKGINEICYKSNQSQFYLYTWKIDDDEYAIVSYGLPLNESHINWKDSPAKTIFDSLVEI